MSTTLSLEASRGRDPLQYRIGGSAPRVAIRPATREELVEALLAAARDRLTVVPWGGGVALARETEAVRFDVALDLTGLDRIVEYDPEDMTLTAECGVTLAMLRKTLAARGQEIPLEAAAADRATLGGVLAANASGPRRLRIGSPRDRILGARFALAEGKLVRTGGKVVKNVAGYGIHRLLCGSRGGLAVIVEASLKVMPAPARRATLVYTMTREQLAETQRWVALPRMEPAALTVLGSAAARSIGFPADDGMFLVVIGFEEEAAWLERQIATVETLMGDPSSRRLDDAAVVALWQMLADLEEGAGPRLSFASAHNNPAVLAPLLDDAAAARLVFHAPAGRLHWFAEAAESERLVRLLAALQFGLVDARGTPPPSNAPQVAVGALRTRIRAALDPDRRMALGERWAAGFSATGAATDRSGATP